MISLLDSMSLIDSKYIEAAAYPDRDKSEHPIKRFIYNFLAGAATIAIICGAVFGFSKLINNRHSRKCASSDMASKETTTDIADIIIVNRYEVDNSDNFYPDVTDSDLCILNNEINLNELIAYYGLPINTDNIAASLSTYFSETTAYSGNDSFEIYSVAGKTYDSHVNSLDFTNHTGTIKINLSKKSEDGKYYNPVVSVDGMKSSRLGNVACYIYEKIVTISEKSLGYYCSYIINDTTITVSGTNLTLEELTDVTKLIMKNIN